MKYIASCSFGKDSLAMVLRLLEESKPLDEVIFFDTGMEFESIYHNRNRIKELLFQKHIRFTELHSQNTFLFDMLESKLWKIFILIFIAILLLNVWGLILM